MWNSRSCSFDPQAEKSNHAYDYGSDDNNLSMAIFVSPAKKRGGGVQPRRKPVLWTLSSRPGGFTLSDLQEAAAEAAAGMSAGSRVPGGSGGGRARPAAPRKKHAGDDEDDDEDTMHNSNMYVNTPY